MSNTVVKSKKKRIVLPPTEGELALLNGALESVEAATHRILLKMDESHGLLQDCVRELRSLKESVYDIDKRIAVLDEGRKTTAAEVRTALTETLAAWEIAKMREAAHTTKFARTNRENDT